MPEIPCIVVVVQSPFGISVGVMPAAASTVRAGKAARREMPTKGGMGDHSDAIDGNSKKRRINQSEAQGRGKGKDGKNFR